MPRNTQPYYVLCTKQTAWSWNVIDYLRGGRWLGKTSPIWNRIGVFHLLFAIETLERKELLYKLSFGFLNYGPSLVFLSGAHSDLLGTRAFPAWMRLPVFLSVS